MNTNKSDYRISCSDRSYLEELKKSLEKKTSTKIFWIDADSFGIPTLFVKFIH